MDCQPWAMSLIKSNTFFMNISDQEWVFGQFLNTLNITKWEGGDGEREGGAEDDEQECRPRRHRTRRPQRRRPEPVHDDAARTEQRALGLLRAEEYWGLFRWDRQRRATICRQAAQHLGAARHARCQIHVGGALAAPALRSHGPCRAHIRQRHVQLSDCSQRRRTTQIERSYGAYSPGAKA